MKNQSPINLFCKYVVCSRIGIILRRAFPKLYIFLKIRSDSIREPEMELLPRLCDKSKISIDVGVLWGSYTYLLAKYSEFCYSFEPNPIIIPFLKKNFCNKNVRIIPKALSDSEKITKLRVPDIYGHSTIEPENKLEDENYVEYNVETDKLDNYGFEKVGFIKIDVEGHEPSVLKGMKNILSIEKPFLFIEVSKKHNQKSIEFVSQFMVKNGYSAFYYKNGFLHDVSQIDKSLSKINNISSNIIFCHNKKINQISDLINSNDYNIGIMESKII